MTESITTESIPNNLQPPPPTRPISELSTAELVAKCIAPVKKEFLRPPPTTRLSSETDKENGDNNNNNGEKKSVVKEKKSKRQLKRERQNERKSALSICPEIAKTGDINGCKYGGNCRFSHDLEAYKSQRPADLEGECPFITDNKRCPYGVTCRFTGSHEAVAGEILDDLKDSEVNVLKKDVQKLLWKNKMKFPKSNDALKELGLASLQSSRSRCYMW